MSDALLVLNAGAGSLKFSVFLDQQPPQPLLRGQLEGLLTEPRFVARTNDSTIGRKEWPVGTHLGHCGALEFPFCLGKRRYARERAHRRGRHRVVHGGAKFTAPALIDEQTLADIETFVPLAPLHQTHNVAAIQAVMQMVLHCLK